MTQEDTQWVSKERQLWNAVQRPVKHRITLHSIQDPARRKQMMLDIEKQKAAEFARGWENYRTWVKH